MTVHGVLEVMTAVMVGVYVAVPRAAGGGAGFYRGVLLMPALAAVGGTLKIAAGWMTRRYRGRAVAMAALLSAPLALGTVACFPTALALSAYGLWVYSHPSVRRAFELGASGTAAAQVEAALRGTPGDDR
jgi:hypothetical protein